MGRSRDISRVLNDAGLITAADLAAGVIPTAKNVQAVSTRLLSDAATIASTSWGTIGATVSITPTSTSSKILLLATFTAKISSTSYYGFLDFVRGATQNISGVTGGIMTVNSTAYQAVTLSFVDSPNTTSAVTYGVSARVNNTLGTLSLQDLSTVVNSTLIAIEIGG